MDGIFFIPQGLLDNLKVNLFLIRIFIFDILQAGVPKAAENG